MARRRKGETETTRLRWSEEDNADGDGATAWWRWRDGVTVMAWRRWDGATKIAARDGWLRFSIGWGYDTELRFLIGWGCDTELRLSENFILIFLIWEEHVSLLEEKCIAICGGYKPPLLSIFKKSIITSSYDIYLWRSF